MDEGREALGFEEEEEAAAEEGRVVERRRVLRRIAFEEFVVWS